MHNNFIVILGEEIKSLEGLWQLTCANQKSEILHYFTSTNQFYKRGVYIVPFI